MNTHSPLLPVAATILILSPLHADEQIPGAPKQYPGKPYNGTPALLPGTIQAKDYDIAPYGANNITFSWQGNTTQGPYRTSPDSIGIAEMNSDAVDIDGKSEKPGQVYIGWTQTGQWMRYTVRVAETGTYIIGAKLAAGATGAKISFTFTPNKNTTGPIEIPTTAGHVPNVEVYHVWEKLDHLAEINLTAGLHILTVKVEDVAGLNFATFTFTKKP